MLVDCERRWGREWADADADEGEGEGTRRLVLLRPVGSDFRPWKLRAAAWMAACVVDAITGRGWAGRRSLRVCRAAVCEKGNEQNSIPGQQESLSKSICILYRIIMFYSRSLGTKVSRRGTLRATATDGGDSAESLRCAVIRAPVLYHRYLCMGLKHYSQSNSAQLSSAQLWLGSESTTLETKAVRISNCGS